MLCSIVEAVEIHHEAGSGVGLHAHERGQLLLVLAGTASVIGEGGWWLAPPGRGVWVPPRVLHGARYSESSRVVQLRLGEMLGSSLPAEPGSIAISDLLRELALESVRLGTQERYAHTQELLGRLMVLQALLPQRGPGLFVPHGRDRRLRRAIDFLRRRPATDMSVDELAKRSSTSSRTLARLFVTETGMTFGRWRDHLRIVCAVDALARGQSIMETALQLGYSSASSFTTSFTRVLGAPPRRYMASMRNSVPGATLGGDAKPSANRADTM
jgi:AraC-like DNA-binding protein